MAGTRLRRSVQPDTTHIVQLIDATTGEVLVEQSRRLSAHYARIRAHRQSRGQPHAVRWRLPLSREAAHFMLAGFLVTLMGLLLWALSVWSNVDAY